MLSRIVQFKLKLLAKLILLKYKPFVVGITGSVGKTSTKEAVFSVVSAKFNARSSEKNYNNEFGLPLTIIGAESPGRSLFGWCAVMFKALGMVVFKKNYPKALVLELGVDRPGDMDYLNSIVKYDIGIVTMVGPSHLEFFSSVEAIRKEKEKLVANVKKGGWAIVNYDNKDSKKIGENCRSKVFSYAIFEKAKVGAQEIDLSFKDGQLAGTSYKLSYDGSTVPVLLPNIIGMGGVYASLAAACVGVALDMNLVDIANCLRHTKPPRGRMNIIPGIKNTLLIDDTYNSSPQSSMSALDLCREVPLEPGAKRWAVLGDMLELGPYTEEGHEAVGHHLAQSKTDVLVVVGERSRDIARGARGAGMSDERIFHFDAPGAAGRFIQDKMRAGDLLLIKGSQGARMEKIVKELMAEPLRAEELLVRQDKEWQ